MRSNLRINLLRVDNDAFRQEDDRWSVKEIHDGQMDVASASARMDKKVLKSNLGISRTPILSLANGKIGQEMEEPVRGRNSARKAHTSQLASLVLWQAHGHREDHALKRLSH